MQKFTVELDELVCKWLEHISAITGEPIENVIANGIFNRISSMENMVYRVFTYNDTER